MAVAITKKPTSVCPACGLTNQGVTTRCLRCNGALPTAIARQCTLCHRLNIGIQSSCLFCRVTLPPAYVPAIAQPLPTCPACHQPLKPAKPFCTSCGHQLTAAPPPVTSGEWRCPYPGCEKAVMPPNKQFCTSCGKRRP